MPLLEVMVPLSCGLVGTRNELVLDLHDIDCGTHWRRLLMTKYRLSTQDQPVPLDQPAALGLMVLPVENLMALPNAPSAAGRSNSCRFRIQTLLDHDSNAEPTG
jgi:hypothetical protein